MQPIGVGIIGTGKHGARYVRHVRQDVPELHLVALCRRDAAAGAEQAASLGARFHADWRALVADPAVEAVIPVVPPSLHPAIAEAVAEAGKGLLIEKPLALTGADAIRVVRRLRAAGVPCLMGHTLRWNTVVGAIRARLPALGPLRAVVLNQRFEPSLLAWLDDPAEAGGGIVMHTGVHSFDLVRFLTGREVARVWCRTARSATLNTDDNFTAMLELTGADAPLVAVSGSRATRGRSGLIDVAAAEGQLVGDHVLGFLHAVRGVERTPVALPEPVPTIPEVLRHFVRVVRAGEAPLASVEDGARAVLVAEACLASAAREQAMEVAPLGA